MQNIDVRFSATSNFGKVKADLAALEAQAASLGAVFQKNAYAKAPTLVDPTSWKVSTRAVHEASRVYRDAASSSGLLTSQQIRATSEAERYTKALQKQKLTFGEMRKHAGIMKQVYQDQLRYQRMTAQYWGTDMSGRAITDITIPKNVPRDLDTVAQRMYMVGQMAKSAGTQIVNMGKNMQWAGRQLTVGFTYPVTLLGAAAGVMAYKVDEAMTRVTKVYDVSAKSQNNEAAKVKELNDVRAKSFDLAQKAAKNYGMSIEDTLNIEQQLAATGLKGDKLFGATEQVARIATLGDLDVTQATDMTVALQTAFRKTIKTTDDLSNAFDYMNAVENATSLSLQDIAEATPRAASAMAALGVSAKQMTVLLVSMREAGVDAAEGANALKSATGTILSPSPSAIAFVKDIAGGKIAKGIQNIAKSSGGNLFIAMKQLHEMLRNLSDTERQQVLVKLFGKYQFNRVSAMIQNLGAAWDGTKNQTHRAIKLMEADQKELADNAKSELDQKMNSASGKFIAAWQSIRAELSEMGKPFLEVATIALEAGTKILSFFNGMDDWKKKAVLGAAAVMAIAGPVIMLGGLFMNLAGQFTTGFGRVLSVVGKMGGAFGLMNKEEQAATLSAKAQNEAALKQQKTTSTLAEEIQILTAAYEKATRAAAAFAESQGVAATATAEAAAAAAKPQTWAPKTPQQQFLGMPGGSAAAMYAAPAQQTAKAYDDAAAKAQMLARTERERLNDQVRNTRAATAEATVRQQIEKRVSGAAVGTAAMSAAMAGMLLTDNKFVNSLSKWLLIGTLVVPAVKTLGTLLATAAKVAWEKAAANIVSARAAQQEAVATGVMAGKFGVLRGGIKGLGAGLVSILGRGGILTLGVAAVGAAYVWAWNKGEEAQKAAAEAYRQQVETSKRVESSTRDWMESMGKVAGKYDHIRNVMTQISSLTPDAAKRQEKAIDYYQTVPEGQTTSPIQDFKAQYGTPITGDLENERAQLAVVQKFIDLQVEGRLSAKQATEQMRAFFIAAGESAMMADIKAQNLLSTWGDVSKKNFDWAGYLKQQMSLFANASDADMKEAGKNAAEAFSSALVNSKGKPGQAKQLLENLIGGSQESLNSAFNEIASKWGIQWYNFLKDQGVSQDVTGLAKLLRSTTMDEFSNLNTSKEGDSKGLGGYNLQMGELVRILKQANNEQDYLLNGLDSLMHFGPEVTSIFDLPGQTQINAFTKSYKEAKEDILTLVQAASQGNGPISDTAKNMLKAVINAQNYAQGLKIGKTYAQALNYFMNQVSASSGRAKDEAEGIGKAIDNVKGKTVTINVKMNQIGGIFQTAMSNVQQEMVDSAMNNFNQRWDAQMAAAQSAWDSRMNALQNRQEAAMNALERRQEDAQDAFEKRWEARKKAVEDAYQKRIDAVNREIEAEQKAEQIRANLFEKEKARLERLAELQNQNIDFNTQLNEGKLDEAAKTLNNTGVSSANAQMDAEQKAAEARTEARIKALEKKNERLEKQRDKEVENLEKLEEKMRKHLERVQEARRRALEKQQQQESAALQASEEAAMASMEKQRDYEEAMLQQRLELFQSYVARNQRDLERWMHEVGLSYDDFGRDVKAKGKEWSEYFRTELSYQIRKAGAEVASDNAWEGVGKKIADKLLQGMGFDNLAEFNRFVATGKRSNNGKGGNDNPVETNHGGGMVGAGGSGRGPIPNTYKGLHRTEQMVRAQKGEYVINKDATARNLPLLSAINSGRDLDDISTYSGRPKSGYGPAMPREGLGGLPFGENAPYQYSFFGGPGAFQEGLAARGFLGGAGRAFQNNYQTGLAKERARERRKQRRKQQNQDSFPGTKNVDVPPGTDPRGAAAIEWAAARIGTSGWHNMCLSFVRQAFGAPGGVYDAKTSWYGTRNKYSTAGGIPAGVPVFWTTGDNGHVVISTGNGGAISTDHPVYDQPGKTTISSVSSWLGASPAGWSADINGKSVYPALRTGGHLRADTMVQAHRGETVLTAPLTKKFQENVANGGGDHFHVTLDLRGAMIKEDVDIEKAVNMAIDARENKLGRKRKVT